jgi:hypothetical protein
MVNFVTLFKAVDVMLAFAEAAKGLKGSGTPPSPPSPDGEFGPDRGLAPNTPPPAIGLAGHIESRLTNIVVVALKEAFDRDHARLELERQQLDDQRRRAEQALQAELRRQAADRELGRLRLLAATSLVGWLASVLVLGLRAAEASGAARGVLAVGWVLLLASLGAAFSAQGRVSAAQADPNGPVATPAGSAAVWLLVGGLALTAISLLL